MQLRSTNIFIQQFFLITIFFKLFMNIWGLHKITVKMPNFYVDISCYLSRNPFMTFTLFWQILWLSNPFVYSKTTPSLLSKKINIMVPISSRILKPFSKNGLLRWTYQTVTVSETTSKAIVRKKHHTFWRKAVLPNVMFFFLMWKILSLECISRKWQQRHAIYCARVNFPQTCFDSWGVWRFFTVRRVRKENKNKQNLKYSAKSSVV